MDVINLADLYNLPPMEWAGIEASLDAGFEQVPGGGGPNRHTCWLTTINPNGSPHVAAVGALWVDGTFWFQTGDQTRKGKNVARDSRCVLSLAADEFDLVVEGDARRVTDRPTVATMAGHWAGNWPVRVDDTGQALTAEFSAPSAGPPPWFIYRIVPRGMTAVATVAPGGATRWRV
jgi:hypothetical protein